MSKTKLSNIFKNGDDFKINTNMDSDDYKKMFDAIIKEKEMVLKRMKKCKHRFELDGGQCVKCGKTQIEIWNENNKEKQ